jgi:hypothetical protein
MGTWPYPGDRPAARARRVAQAYRAALLDHAPGKCAELDDLMRQWGQTWVVPRVVTYHPDDWLSVHQAADLAAVELATLRGLRMRGRLVGRPNGRTWEYQAKDILALNANKRRRTPPT